MQHRDYHTGNKERVSESLPWPRPRNRETKGGLSGNSGRENPVMLSLQFRGDDGISFSRSMAKGHDGGWVREKRRRHGLLYSWWEDFGCLFPWWRKVPGRFCLFLVVRDTHGRRRIRNWVLAIAGWFNEPARSDPVGHDWFPGSPVLMSRLDCDILTAVSSYHNSDNSHLFVCCTSSDPWNKDTWTVLLSKAHNIRIQLTFGEQPQEDSSQQSNLYFLVIFFSAININYLISYARTILTNSSLTLSCVTHAWATWSSKH